MDNDDMEQHVQQLNDELDAFERVCQQGQPASSASSAFEAGVDNESPPVIVSKGGTGLLGGIAINADAYVHANGGSEGEVETRPPLQPQSQSQHQNSQPHQQQQQQQQQQQHRHQHEAAVVVVDDDDTEEGISTGRAGLWQSTGSAGSAGPPSAGQHQSARADAQGHAGYNEAYPGLLQQNARSVGRSRQHLMPIDYRNLKDYSALQAGVLGSSVVDVHGSGGSGGIGPGGSMSDGIAGGETDTVAHRLFLLLGNMQLLQLSVDDLGALSLYAKRYWAVAPASKESLASVAKRKLGLEGHVDCDGSVPFDKIEAAVELETLRVTELEVMFTLHNLVSPTVAATQDPSGFGSGNGNGNARGKRGRGGRGGRGRGGRGSGSGGIGSISSALADASARDGGGGGGDGSDEDGDSGALSGSKRRRGEEDGAAPGGRGDAALERAGAEFEADFVQMRRRIHCLAQVLAIERRCAMEFAPTAHTTAAAESYIDPLAAFGVDATDDDTKQTYVLFLLRRALAKGLKRRGGYVYEQIRSPPLLSAGGRYQTHPTCAWRRLMPMTEWVKREASQWANKAMWRAATTNNNEAYAVAYLNAAVDSEFPLYEPHGHWFAFRNGLFWVGGPHGPEFFPYGDPALPPRVTACKYHNHTFSGADISAYCKEARTQRLATGHGADGSTGPPSDRLPVPVPVPLASDSAASVSASAGSASASASASASQQQQQQQQVLRAALKPNVLGDWERIPTPAFDSILDIQLDPSVNKNVVDDEERQAIKRVAYSVFGGRYLFEVNEYDRWEVMGMLIGRAGAGKSTWLNAIRRIFAAEDVGTLANNANERFGLQNLLDKRIIMCYEMTARFGLEQTQWQSMLSGEALTAQVKGKDDVTIEKWKTQLLAAGNEMAAYGDNNGAVARRMLMLFFDVRVPTSKQDPQLDWRIERELPFFLAKIAIAYRTFAARFGEHNIWTKDVPVYGAQDVVTREWVRTGSCSVIPPYFERSRERLSATTHPLTNFLKNDEKITLYTRDDGELFSMPFSRLKSLVDEHLKAAHMKPMEWNKETKYLDKFEDYGIAKKKIDGGEYRGQTFMPQTEWLFGICETEAIAAFGAHPPALTHREADVRANIFASLKDTSAAAAAAWRAAMHDECVEQLETLDRARKRDEEYRAEVTAAAALAEAQAHAYQAAQAYELQGSAVDAEGGGGFDAAAGGVLDVSL